MEREKVSRVDAWGGEEVKVGKIANGQVDVRRERKGLAGGEGYGKEKDRERE